jgi:hypothetical protein
MKCPNQYNSLREHWEGERFEKCWTHFCNSGLVNLNILECDKHPRMQGNTLTSTLHHHYATRMALVCCVDIDQKQGPGRLSAVRPSLYEPPNRTYWSVSTALHWCRWSGRRHKNLVYDKTVVLQRVVIIMTRLQAGQQEETGFIPGRDKSFIFA